MSTDKKMWEQWKDWRLESEKFEDYTNEEKESINEALTDKLQPPSDVSYYKRDWSKVFESWGDVDYGPRESDMYDWNVRQNYTAVVKEFNAHMTKVAKKLNVAARGLDEASQKWRHLMGKHRRKDRS